MKGRLKYLSFACLLILFCAHPKPKVQAEVPEKSWSDFKGKMKWPRANATCKSLGMQLPTLTDFQNIYFRGFADDWKRDSGFYWTRAEREDGRAEIFDFTFGVSNSYPKDYAKFGVRCIGKDQLTLAPGTESAAAKAENWSSDLDSSDWYDAARKCERIGMKLPLRSDLFTAHQAQLTEAWIKETKERTSGEYWTEEEYSSDKAYVMYHHWAKPYAKSSAEKYPGVIDVIGGNHTEFHVRCIRK